MTDCCTGSITSGSELFAIIGEGEPKDPVDVAGVPFWAKDAVQAQPGDSIVISGGP